MLRTKHVRCTSTDHSTGEVPVPHMGPTHTTLLPSTAESFIFTQGSENQQWALWRGDVPGTGPATTTTMCVCPAIQEASLNVLISAIKLWSKCCTWPNKCRPLQLDMCTLSKYPETRPVHFPIGKLTSSLQSSRMEFDQRQTNCHFRMRND